MEASKAELYHSESIEVTTWDSRWWIIKFVAGVDGEEKQPL